MPAVEQKEFDRTKITNPERLAAVKLFVQQLHGSSSTGEFDSITEEVTQLIGVPLSLVTLVDDEYQNFIGSCGAIPAGVADIRKTALTSSFCQYCVQSGRPFIVENALRHPIVFDNGAVKDLQVAAYMGVPLSVNNQTLGALCAIDTKPRDWTPGEMLVLMEQGKKVIDILTAKRN